MFEVLQGSARVLKNKKPRKTRGSANIRTEGGGAYNRMIFFCFQVDGLIARRAYKWRGAYNRNFTVLCYSNKVTSCAVRNCHLCQTVYSTNYNVTFRQ